MEGPKGILKSPWSLSIGIFKILLSIISPQGVKSNPNWDQKKAGKLIAGKFISP
jgi:hypothetical protein